MVGRKVLLRVEKGPPRPARARARGPRIVRSATTRACRCVKDVSFEVRGGEIVGIAGVAGNGQTELLEALAGIRAPEPAARSWSAAQRGPRPGPGARAAASPTCRRTACAWAWCAASRPGRTRSSATRRATSTRPAASCDRLRIVDAVPRAGWSDYDVRPREPQLEADLLLRRQPAEAGPRPRDGARARTCCWSASRRAASTSAPSSSSTAASSRMRDAGKAVLVVSVELDEILSLCRPHPGDVRRRHRRRARPDRGRRAQGRAADGGRSRTGRRPDGRAAASCRAGPSTSCSRCSTSCSPSSSSGLIVLADRREPARGRRSCSSTAPSATARRSATRSTTPPTSSSPASPSPSPSTPACSTSAARARPISAGSASALVGARRRPPAGPVAAAARDPGRGRVRRRLGLHPGLAAGEARQPHRHHDDHVQLHRRRADDLPAGQRADRARLADRRRARGFRRRLAALAARAARRARHRPRPAPLNALARRWRSSAASSSGCYVWHTPLGLRAARGRPAARRRRSTPASRPPRQIILAMMLSGALAGLMASTS